MALHKHVKYKDKYGHLIEATFNLKKKHSKSSFSRHLRKRIYRSRMARKSAHDELYETKFTTNSSDISVENTLDKIPEWLLRKKS